MCTDVKFWAGTQMFELESKHVGDTFTIRVALPVSYEAGERKYPVLFCLDSDASFGLAVSTMTYINVGANFGMGKNIPDMIVVGIGYEHGVLPWLFTRVRDFTPSEDPSFNYNNPAFQISESGKAEKFLQFLREELMPSLESMYRVDTSLNVVASHSMSALFAMYEMLQPERIFQKYILACPFIEWGGDTMFRMEAAYAESHQELAADAFFTITGHEPTPTYIESTRKFIDILKSRAYKNFNADLVFYENDNHFSVWPKAFSDGLAYVFNIQ